MKSRDDSSNPPAAASVSGQRAALYMRVSTGRQAEHDLSIPDQRRQLQNWCRAQGYTVATEFIEGGASAGGDRRPVFQQMIERACDGEQAFELILVHSYSRFFRGGIRTRVLPSQAGQAWRQGGFDHSASGRRERAGASDDAQGHRLVR